jgi:hypothetical protein
MMCLFVGLLKLAVKPDMLVTIVGSFSVVTLILFVFRVRSREAGVNILWCLLVLAVLSCLHTRNICIL